MDNNELLEKFIRYFDNDKYKFENFCKILLKWLDFDDIQVTKRCGDGGIDLKCTKKEIEELNLNTIDYVVQAKCYSISNKVGPHDIRDFKGSKTDMSVRRIFITTSDYTKGALDEATDYNQPVTLINGMQLISFCKSYNDKMFDIKYFFNSEKLDDLLEDKNNVHEIETIEHRITKNDVRARILRIPTEYKKLVSNVNSFDLEINGNIIKKYNISTDKAYFGGVTNYYKDFIKDDEFNEALSTWYYDKNSNKFIISIK